jgi:multidrug efflux pump subunit AcrA (membrane-fusion protein)
MARRAKSWRQSGRHVIDWRDRPVVIRHVAVLASRLRRRKSVVVANVALHARRARQVKPGQWEARRAVIKGRRGPGCRVVARRALRCPERGSRG